MPCAPVGPKGSVGCSSKGCGSGGCDREIFYINPEDLPQLQYGSDGLALPGQDWFFAPPDSSESAEGIYRAMLAELNKKRLQTL